MGRGLIGGFLWGSVVSVLALGTASLLVAPPISRSAAVPQDRMEVPSGSGFTGERSEGATRLPAPDRPTAVDAGPMPVSGDDVQSPPVADTAPAAQPQVAAEVAAPAPQVQPGAEATPAAPAAEAPGLPAAAPQPPMAEAVNGALGVPVPVIENPVPAAPQEAVPQMTSPEARAPAATTAPEAPSTEALGRAPAVAAPAPAAPSGQSTQDGQPQIVVASDAPRGSATRPEGPAAVSVASAPATPDPTPGAPAAQTSPDGPPPIATEPAEAPQPPASVSGINPAASSAAPQPGPAQDPLPQVAAASSDAMPSAPGARQDRLPQIGSATQDAPATASPPQPQATADAGQDRLPQIVPPPGAASQPASEAPRVEAAPVQDEAPVLPGRVTASGTPDKGLGALARNSIPFTDPAGRPLMALVLVDIGAAGLDAEVLRTFSFPVTFALDPGRPDATEAAAAYRAAGFEVIALTPEGAAGLPATARPADVEAALGIFFAALPQSVALMDRRTDGFQQSGPVSDQVIAYLRDSGHGLLTFDQGLNTTWKKARREGVPAATVFRALDADGESAATVKRYLDRAALKAGQEGWVVMTGVSRPETVTALFEWALSSKASTVALAPLSAVLRAQ